MSLAYVVDGETELDSELFNPIIDRVNGDAGPLANMRAGVANVLDYPGVDPTGVADSVAGIASASGDAAVAVGDDARSLVRLAPGKSFRIGRRVPGSQTNGGVFLDTGVDLDGAGATLLLADNSSFVTNRFPIFEAENDEWSYVADHYATITADVAVGDVQLTVASTSGFNSGDPVFLRLNDNAWDSNEVKDTLYAKVLTVDGGTTLTLDRPVLAACDVSEQSANNKVIQKLWNPNVGGFVRNLTLIDPLDESSSAELGIDLRYMRSVVVENIVAENPGAGAVLLVYCESSVLRNIHVRKSVKQGDQGSKGRAIGMWNSKQVRVENLYAEQFEGAAIFLESYCRQVEFDGLHIVNNFPDRDDAGTALIFVVQGSQAHFRNVLIEGNGGCALLDEGGTTGNEISFENLWVNTASQLLQIPLTMCVGTLRIGDAIYGELVRRTVPFRVTASMGASFDLPTGLYRRVRIFVTDTTGITAFYVLNTEGGLGVITVTGTLVSNTLVDIPTAGNYGSVWPFNDVDTKQIGIYTDGTVPDGVYGFVEVEYWPTVTDDQSDGRQELALVNPPAYTISNLTIDRTFDADSTSTAELADVLGTLIADLQQSGWIA